MQINYLCLHIKEFLMDLSNFVGLVGLITKKHVILLHI